MAMSASALRVLDPKVQQPHELHGSSRVWAETNCYVDLLIELLGGLRLNPVVALGFVLGIEFEGDQWSFIKYPIDDLRVAYGLDVSELALFRPLEEHLAEQVRAGRVVIVEVDAFHLPDTRATSYLSDHVKTSIAVTGIDVAGRTLEYFHGAGHFVVMGADFDALLRRGDPARFTGDVLAPYAELVKCDRVMQWSGDDQVAIAERLTAMHLGRRRRAADSAARFAQRLVLDAPERLRDLPSFHAYAFATVRQLGAASELAADLFRFTHRDLVASQFLVAAQSCKTLQFKLARVAAGRSIDLSVAAKETTEHWMAAMSAASTEFGVPA